MIKNFKKLKKTKKFKKKENYFEQKYKLFLKYYFYKLFITKINILSKIIFIRY